MGVRMFLNFITITFITYLISLYESKKINAHHNDYMADIDIQSVDVGKPVELKCVSPKDFSACFFSKTDGNLYYRIRPNASFEENRIQCLCDREKSINPNRVCGLYIAEAKQDDAGEWRCEVEITENQLFRKVSAMMTLKVNGKSSTA